MNQTEKLRTLIRESIQEYIKEIDQAANEAAMDARINKCEEAIEKRQTKLENLKNLEEAADMLDEAKVKMMEKEIAELKKAKAKFEKQKEKMLNKGKKKEEVVTDAKTEEAMVDEADVMDEMNMSDEKPQEEALNESFLKMQKLAGVITEAQYNQKKSLVENQINEEKDINEFGKSLMDKLKKSGFDAKFVDNEVKKIELEKIVKENPKKLAVVYFDKAINYVSIITNKDNQDEALKIAESSKSLLPDGYTVSKQGGYFVQIHPPLG